MTWSTWDKCWLTINFLWIMLTLLSRPRHFSLQWLQTQLIKIVECKVRTFVIAVFLKPKQHTLPLPLGPKRCFLADVSTRLQIIPMNMSLSKFWKRKQKYLAKREEAIFYFLQLYNMFNCRGKYFFFSSIRCWNIPEQDQQLVLLGICVTD